MPDHTEHISSEDFLAMQAHFSKDDLSDAFKGYLRQARLAGLNLLEPEYEWEFNKPDTKHRLDLAWPDIMWAVELEGGVFSGGRHVRGKGYTEDIRKYNIATLKGWRLLRYTGEMLHNDPFGVIQEIAAALEL